MKLQTAQFFARKYGELCRNHPNNVDHKHWEALQYARTEVLMKKLKSKNKTEKHG